MDRGELNEPPTAPEASDADTRRRISARQLVWVVALTVVVCVPALVVLVSLSVGPRLSREEVALLGKWEFVGSPNRVFVIFRADRTGGYSYAERPPIMWSVDGDRLNVWYKPESHWLELWYRIVGGPEGDDLEDCTIEFTPEDHVILRSIESSDTAELRRVNRQSTRSAK